MFHLDCQGPKWWLGEESTVSRDYSYFLFRGHRTAERMHTFPSFIPNLFVRPISPSSSTTRKAPRLRMPRIINSLEGQHVAGSGTFPVLPVSEASLSEFIVAIASRTLA